jgi:hypothetical protein
MASVAGFTGDSIDPKRVVVHVAHRGGRGELALREPVDLVVEHQVRDIRVAPRGMRKMASPDREPVPVAAGGEHEQVGPRDLEARRERQHAAVERVEAVAADVAGEAARAADAGHHRHVLARPGLGQGLRQGGQDAGSPHPDADRQGRSWKSFAEAWSPSGGRRRAPWPSSGPFIASTWSRSLT